jgi:phosphatidylglycerophosphate synthase
MWFTPNRITAMRVAMAFAAVALFGRSLTLNLLAVALTIAAIAFDAVDGYIARRFRLATPLGAQFDILGDRLIEGVFFTWFAVAAQISFWVPVVFLARGMVTDFVRAYAARRGRVGWSERSMLAAEWAKRIVNSRASRGAYAALKCACFVALGLDWTLAAHPPAAWFAGVPAITLVHLGAQGLVWAAVGFCLIRGVPVLWEGQRYFSAARAPRGMRRSQPHRAGAAIVAAAPLRAGSAQGAAQGAAR